MKGVYEPTEAETKCAFDEEEVCIRIYSYFFQDEILISRLMNKPKKQLKKKRKKEVSRKKTNPERNNLFFCLEKSVGIPEFWLQVFKNSDVLSELIKVFFN